MNRSLNEPRFELKESKLAVISCNGKYKYKTSPRY